MIKKLRKSTYALKHAFTQFVENPDVQKELVADAFWFEQEGGVFPGGIGTHCAVLLAAPDPDGSLRPRQSLLVAHRVSRESGYWGRAWSASFEEQFAPVKSLWGGRTHERDLTLSETAIRGVREEFLTEGFLDPVHVSFHAVILELPTLCLQLVGVIDLPNTTFDHVRDLWRGGAHDRGEHDSLAALPFRQDVLSRALQVASPGELLIGSACQDAAGKEALWHPTSQARIACCLWLLEEGLL